MLHSDTQFAMRAVSEFPGLQLSCACGKNHEVNIHTICVEDTAIRELILCIKNIATNMHVLIVADENTAEISTCLVKELLIEKELTTKRFVFPGVPVLIPDEKAIGRVLIECEPDIGCILAIGSGTINDICRFVSDRIGIPYIVFGTAPSMDGYASTVSPLIVGGKKITYEACYPHAIFAEPKMLEKAPVEMLRAGFGDILGKYTALSDWRLSNILLQEYFCPEIAALVERAIETCVEPLLQSQRLHAKSVMEALIISGVAMGMVGNSRPASGAEHHFAHFWEVSALSTGNDHPLHGNSVGTATVVVAKIYGYMADDLPSGFIWPDPERIVALLRLSGAAENPKNLGIPKKVFYESVLHAMEIRERFTILRFAFQKGKLGMIAEKLTKEFYGS